jgi:uncharacterized protein (DUF1697 family)
VVTTYVALLRGVNLGGHHRLAMGDLRACVEAVGGADPVTYIQSGNVVFDHPARGAEALRADLEASIGAAAGFAVPVTLRTASQWAAVVRANPYPRAGPTQLHVAFLNRKPPAAAWRGFDPKPFAPEECTRRGREVYLYLPNGMGRAKLPSALRALREPATARNWNSVLALHDLAGPR